MPELDKSSTNSTTLAVPEQLQQSTALVNVADDIDWREEVLKHFAVATPVSKAVAESGSKQIWPLQCDGRPSRLVRWNILEAEGPYRCVPFAHLSMVPCCTAILHVYASLRMSASSKIS